MKNARQQLRLLLAIVRSSASLLLHNAVGYGVSGVAALPGQKFVYPIDLAGYGQCEGLAGDVRLDRWQITVIAVDGEIRSSSDAAADTYTIETIKDDLTGFRYRTLIGLTGNCQSDLACTCRTSYEAQFWVGVGAFDFEEVIGARRVSTECNFGPNEPPACRAKQRGTRKIKCSWLDWQLHLAAARE